MRNILICGYRDWAHDLFVNVDRCVIDNCVYVDDKDILDTMIDEYEPKFIFFIGWSWIIKDDIINNYPCICLHPSLLPKYRGGSPMQHQIINGEKTSAVTLFEMDEGIDTGDILYQKEFSLDDSDIDFLISDKNIANYFENADEYLDNHNQVLKHLKTFLEM